MWKTAIITGMLLLAATAMANTIQIGGTTVEYYLVTEPFYGRHYEPILTNGEGHIVFNMTLSKDFTITPNMMKTWKKWQIGNMTLKNTTIYVLSDINYTALIPNGTVEDCTPVNRTINNETGETQIFNICWNRTTYREEIISTLDWLPITTWTAKKDQTYYIDIKADFFIGMGKSSSDIEVNFSGFDLGFTTFNASMDHKMLDEIEYALGSPLTGFPYPINGSGGFNLGNPTGTQNVWALATTVNGTNYLYYDNNSVYQVANGSEASAVPFEVEKGNTTSYQNQTVWNSSTYRGVWHLSESGTTLYDSSAWGNNATKQGTVIYNTSGKIAAAYSQQGWASATNYIRIPSSTSLNFTGSASWEAWIFMNNVTHFVNGGMAVCKGNKNYAIGIFGDGDGTKTGKVFCRVSDGSTFDRTATSTSVLNNYTWYHIGCSWTNAGGLILYINGARAATQTPDAKAIPQTNTPLYIMSGQGEPDWNGSVDEVRVMNVEMPPSYFNASYLSMAGTFSVLGTEEDTGEPPIGYINYTLNQTSSTCAGQSVTHSTKWNTSQTLDSYMFFFNNGTNWTDGNCGDNSIEATCEYWGCTWTTGTTGSWGLKMNETFTDKNNWTDLIGTGWTKVSSPPAETCLYGSVSCLRSADTAENWLSLKTNISMNNITDCELNASWYVADTFDAGSDYFNITIMNQTNTRKNIMSCTGGNSSCEDGTWHTTLFNISNIVRGATTLNITITENSNNANEIILLDDMWMECLTESVTDTCTGTPNYEYKNFTFTFTAGDDSWANISKIPAAEGSTIKWKTWANTTAGLSNMTTNQSYVTTDCGGGTCWTCYGTKANIPSGTKCQINSLSNLCGS